MNKEIVTKLLYQATDEPKEITNCLLDILNQETITDIQILNALHGNDNLTGLYRVYKILETIKSARRIPKNEPNADKFKHSNIIKRSNLSPSAKLILLEINGYFQYGRKYYFNTTYLGKTLGFTAKNAYKYLIQLIEKELIFIDESEATKYLVPNLQMIEKLDLNNGYV